MILLDNCQYLTKGGAVFVESIFVYIFKPKHTLTIGATYLKIHCLIYSSLDFTIADDVVFSEAKDLNPAREGTLRFAQSDTGCWCRRISGRFLNERIFDRCYS